MIGASLDTHFRLPLVAGKPFQVSGDATGVMIFQRFGDGSRGD
jgi:hypothetical protein